MLLRKSLATAGRPVADADGRVRIIVKTLEPNYVPPGVTVRSRIDEMMFTGEVDAALLADLAEDACVDSVSRANKVRQIG